MAATAIRSVQANGHFMTREKCYFTKCWWYSVLLRYRRNVSILKVSPKDKAMYRWEEWLSVMIGTRSLLPVLALSVYDLSFSIQAYWCCCRLSSFHRWGSPIHNSGNSNDDGGMVVICSDCHLIIHSKPCCFPHHHPHWELHPVSRQWFQ